MRNDVRIEILENNLVGRHAESVAILQSHIATGDLVATVMLARMGEAAGLSQDAVDEMIAHVESVMDPRDPAVHLELSKAYDQRLGNLPYEEKALRSFSHLVSAAELGGGATCSLAVARIYLTGAIGVVADESQALRWYRRAVDEGSEEALQELRAVRNGSA